MTVPAGTLRPDTYTQVNTRTERTGLPASAHKVVFMTSDANAPTLPTPVYDSKAADTLVGTANSIAGRMVKAAITANAAMDVSIMGKHLPA